MFNRVKRSPTINLTPLIDILFILILFFVVSTRLVDDKSIGLKLPQSSTSDSKPQPALVLEVFKDQLIYLNGAKTPLEVLEKQLKTHADKKEGKGEIVFKIDKKVPHGFVIKLMDIAKQSGLSKLSFAVEDL